MARQILFVQGAGKGVHRHWDSKLVASLERGLGEFYDVRYPRMPGEGNPRYEAWKDALSREIEGLEDRAVLVGHSLGGTILIHVLAEQPSKQRFKGLFILAAPFIGEGGWQSDDIDECRDFSDRLPSDLPVYLYHGADDGEVATSHVHLYAKAIPQAIVRALEGRDHQLGDDLTAVAQDIRSLG